MNRPFPFDEPVSADLVNVRKKTNHTHEKLALFSGVSLSAWYRYFKGEQVMPYANWIALNAQLYTVRTGNDIRCSHFL